MPPNEPMQLYGRLGQEQGSADRRLRLAAWAAGCAVSLLLFWILSDLLRFGLGRISWEFLTSAPRRAGAAGGIGPILVSTGLILGVTLAVVLPLGLATAIFLAEFTSSRSWLGRRVRLSLDVLAGVPSIVFGLFGNAFFSQTLGMGFSILSGGLTLACMALPLLVRTVEEGIGNIAQEHKLAAAGLGFSLWSSYTSLILPAALPAIAVGVILSMGRALAETAALIFTSGYVARTPGSLLDSGRSLSVHIYDLAMNIPGGEANAYATALVLVTILILLNGATHWIARLWKRKAGHL